MFTFAPTFTRPNWSAPKRSWTFPLERKDIKVLVTEENLKRVGIFTDGVGTLIPFYKFRNDASLNPKAKGKYGDAEDSDGSYVEIIASDGRARLVITLVRQYVFLLQHT